MSLLPADVKHWAGDTLLQMPPHWLSIASYINSYITRNIKVKKWCVQQYKANREMPEGLGSSPEDSVRAESLDQMLQSSQLSGCLKQTFSAYLRASSLICWLSEFPNTTSFNFSAFGTSPADAGSLNLICLLCFSLIAFKHEDAVFRALVEGLQYLFPKA